MLGLYSPAVLRSLTAMSVFSQVKVGPFRPKCPPYEVCEKTGRASFRWRKRGQAFDLDVDICVLPVWSFGVPRTTRIEYGGAVYHVLNRGNYRQDIFAVAGSAEAFERTLFDCCSRFGWRLFAYVLMSNHYHCCFKMQDADLVAGMQWLQSTFANRFNRFVRDRGHVFQGRYKALLVEEGPSVLRVVNYIHLNPVRAGLQTVETLKQYSYSSFPKYFLKSVRHVSIQGIGWLRPGI